MSNKLENISLVSLATVGSRILGLLRDILVFSIFGTTVINSAFQFAFTLPNLFRRLLGEGALTSAVVPLLSDELKNNDRKSLFDLFNKILTRTFITLLIIILVMIVLLILLRNNDGLPHRWHLGAEYGIVLLPYMALVCLAALFAAGLNVFNHFITPALTPIIFNFILIVSLGVFGCLFSETAEVRIWFLCAGVLIGGLAQAIITARAFQKKGWQPKFDLRFSKKISELLSLFLPGLAGAAIVQINILVSRVLAFSLDESAVSILYLASRLIELPLGIFAISVTTVLFPNLSLFASKKDFDGFAKEGAHGIRLILAITLPAALGLIVLRKPILTLLFDWGAFGSAEVSETASPLLIMAIGLPFYSWIILMTRKYHALKDMTTPVKLSFQNLILNVVLSLLLMHKFGVNGLATANTLALVCHSILMYWFLVKKRPEISRYIMPYQFLIILFAGCGMSVVTFLGWSFVSSVISSEKIAALICVITIIPLGMLTYFLSLNLLRFKEWEDLLELILTPLRKFKLF